MPVHLRWNDAGFNVKIVILSTFYKVVRRLEQSLVSEKCSIPILLLLFNNEEWQPLVKKKKESKAFHMKFFIMDVAYSWTHWRRREERKHLGFEWKQWLPVISVSNSFMCWWFCTHLNQKSLLNVLGKVITREHFLYVL